MHKYLMLFLALFLIQSCSKDGSGSKNGSFSFVVSGSAQADIDGKNCRSGAASNNIASSFITMDSGDNEILTLDIFLEELVPGDYMVNAGFVNGNFQPTKVGDASGELQLGNKFYDTASGDGGRVTILSIDGKLVKGNFQVSMLELVGGTAGTEPKINVAGDFSAVMQ